MKILIIEHVEFETPGYIEDWAASNNYTLTFCSPYKGEALPLGSSFDLIISMGGSQSAGSDLTYLQEEVKFLCSAIKANIPVFGFCLGAQLIGIALGASVEQSPYKEIGIHPIALTEEGIRDPLLKGLPNTFPVAHWHGDMPGLTQEAVVLAKSEGCPRQIVRYLPHVYGFQCHPEMTLQGAEELIKNCSDDFTSDRYVQTAEEILAQDFYAINHSNMVCILENFLVLRKSWSDAVELATIQNNS